MKPQVKSLAHQELERRYNGLSESYDRLKDQYNKLSEQYNQQEYQFMQLAAFKIKDILDLIKKKP